MASGPSAEKQKTDPFSNPPIAFHAPGLKPDVCLKVFDQDYHVHSVLLKLHSEFFRKFLDSPDKVALGNNSTGGFTYTLITKVDEDGKDWHLIAAPALMTEVF